MKILIFPGNFLPYIGGLETHVDEFSKFLSKRGYEVVIFTPKVEGGDDYEKRYDNVLVIRYPGFYLTTNWAFPKFWSLKFWRMFFSLYKKDFDIVMTRTRFFFNSFLGAFFAKFRLRNRKRLIHVEHGSDYVYVSSNFVNWCSYFYDLTFGYLVFLLSDKVVGISEASFDFCLKFSKPSKTYLIRRGVDFSIYNTISKYDLSEYSDRVVLCWLGRMMRWKGVENSIRAFKNLPSDIKSQCVFLIIGSGDDYTHLKRVAHGEKNIFFMGSRDFKEAISILKSSSIYVHSAYPGGALSNSLLQAMYSSLGVVASPNEGAKDVVDDNTGILLKDNSVESLKTGMEKLIRDPKLRKRLGKNAHKHIKEDFSWDRVIDEYEEKVF